MQQTHATHATHATTIWWSVLVSIDLYTPELRRGYLPTCVLCRGVLDYWLERIDKRSYAGSKNHSLHLLREMNHFGTEQYHSPTTGKIT